MAKVDDNPECPVCGDTALSELDTNTNEMTIGCDNCGFCADTAIEIDTTGHYFWLETQRYPMRQGKVQRGRDKGITPNDRLCDCAVKTEESDELERLCKAYLEASSLSAKTDAVKTLMDSVAAMTVRVDGSIKTPGGLHGRGKITQRGSEVHD